MWKLGRSVCKLVDRHVRRLGNSTGAADGHTYGAGKSWIRSQCRPYNGGSNHLIDPASLINGLNPVSERLSSTSRNANFCRRPYTTLIEFFYSKAVSAKTVQTLQTTLCYILYTKHQTPNPRTRVTKTQNPYPNPKLTKPSTLNPETLNPKTTFRKPG